MIIFRGVGQLLFAEVPKNLEFDIYIVNFTVWSIENTKARLVRSLDTNLCY